VPVIASGDAFSAEECMDIMSETGADFVMIARGAQGDPDIFKRCTSLYRGEEQPPKSAESLMQALMTQGEIACELKGESKALPELRKHALWYLGNLTGAKPLKLKAANIKTLGELREICLEALNLKVKE